MSLIDPGLAAPVAATVAALNQTTLLAASARSIWLQASIREGVRLNPYRVGLSNPDDLLDTPRMDTAAVPHVANNPKAAESQKRFVESHLANGICRTSRLSDDF